MFFVSKKKYDRLQKQLSLLLTENAQLRETAQRLWEDLDDQQKSSRKDVSDAVIKQTELFKKLVNHLTADKAEVPDTNE